MDRKWSSAALAAVIAGVLYGGPVDDTVRYGVWQDGIPITDSTGKPLLYATEVEAGMALQKVATEQPQSEFKVVPEGEWLVPPQESGNPPSPEPAPVLETRLVYDATSRGDNAPSTLYQLDGSTLPADTKLYVEVLLDYRPHHVLFSVNGKVIRRENVYPYTHAGSYAAGSYLLEAIVYQTEDLVKEVVSAKFVANSTASTTPDPAPLTTVEFQWTAPESREDGTPLRPEEIANFALLWAGSRVLLPGTERSAARAFPSGSYEFSMTAIDLAGLESVPSESVKVSL